MSSNTEAVNQTVEILQQSNYEVYQNLYPQLEMCFELYAHHPSNQFSDLIIKFIQNIDNIKPYYIHELKLVSRLFAALPLIIGDANRRDQLEDNSVYKRNNIISVNVNTFGNIIHNSKLALSIAKKGGFFVSLNGQRLTELRNKKGLTKKQLAEQLGISAKTVSNYEYNKMRSSTNHASKLNKIFHENLVDPFDFFDYMKQAQKIDTIKRINVDNISRKHKEIIKEINEVVERTGFQIYWSKRSPFDVMVYQDDEDTNNIIEYTFVGGISCEKTKDLEHSIQKRFISSIGVDGGFICDGEDINFSKMKADAVPYILPKEFKILEDPKEFKNLMKKRRMAIDWQ
jgi:putative transcriptional regulator